MKYCPSCGSDNEDNAAYCRRCGKKLDKPPAEKGTPAGTPGGNGTEAESEQQQQQGGGGAPHPAAPPDSPSPMEPPPYPPAGTPRGFPRWFGGKARDYSGPVVYAGFWIRFLAFLIDVMLVSVVFSWPFRFWYSGPGWWAAGLGSLAAIIYLAAFFLYFIMMTGYYGQTLGKMALRLRVVNQDMTALDYGQAAAREFSMILSAVILFIGFFMAGFDGRKRALHDIIAGTYVIKT